MDKSKSQMKREAVMGADVNKTAPVVAIGQTHVNKPTHRYYCDACTGIAFFAIEGEFLPRTAICQSCGKELRNLKRENLISL